ncbi:ParB family protein [Pseudarthrobacter oxydans]|uniref:ParB family protein n=1 Tax=Pseudarthrobacter oxydans TaxID=1671 RepID=UPI00344E8A12
MSQNREPISGPPTRRPAASVQSLLRANREPAAETPAAEAAPARVTQTKQVTFYMRVADLQRAKAAYQATSSQEMDASWSDFIARAVMNEVGRRERVHNNGEPFSGGTRNLTPGRKLSS